MIEVKILADDAADLKKQVAELFDGLVRGVQVDDTGDYVAPAPALPEPAAKECDKPEKVRRGAKAKKADTPEAPKDDPFPDSDDVGAKDAELNKQVNEQLTLDALKAKLMQVSKLNDGAGAAKIYEKLQEAGVKAIKELPEDKWPEFAAWADKQIGGAK